MHLLFTRDGKGLISAGGEAVVRLWDPASGKEIRQFEGHEAPVRSAALSPDGKTLAAGAEDQTIRTWDVATGRPLRHWSLPDGACAQVAFSASGQLLASGGENNSIVLWDVRTGKEVRRLKGPEAGQRRGHGREELLSLAFTPDGRHLLAVHGDGVILRDLASGKRLRHYDSPFGGGWQVNNGRGA
jgi:WD40 repeat protein